jgi:hypothetical protein
MDTTPDPNQASPRQVLLDSADEELAHAQEQLTRAGEEMARAEEHLSRLEQDATRRALWRERSSFGGAAMRGFTGLVLAAGVFAAAIVSQSSYGDTAKHIVAKWTPRLAATASPPPDEPGLPAQLSPRITEANAAQIAVPPQSSPQDAAPAPVPVPPELTQLLQSMARDIAALGQGIEELKTKQEQMARDNASAVEQLKAGQDQMARAVAKVSEAKASETKAFDAKVSGARASDARASNANASAQNVRPKTSAAPPASRTHRPVAARPSTPAPAQP